MSGKFTYQRMVGAVCLGLLSGCVFSMPELKGSPQELRAILYPADKIVTISAEADEKAYSDRAIVSLVITTESKRLSQSMGSNSELRQKIRASLVEVGIDAEAIKSSKFSSSPEFGWFGSKPSSYKVVNRMAISITQEKHLKDIAAVADTYDEVVLSNTTFEHSQKDEFREKVKAKALAKIIKEKEFYEKSLGLKLATIGIRDDNVRQRGTRGAVLVEEVIVTGLRKNKGGRLANEKYREEASPSFDEVKYEAKLSVDFKIE